MPRQGVVALGRWLVRAPTADQIDRNHPMARRQEAGDHVAIEIGPGRIAVDQHDGLSVSRAFIDIVDPNIAAILVLDGQIVRLPRKIRQVGKTVFGGAQHLHGETLSS